jgi:hypothetical protein
VGAHQGFSNRQGLIAFWCLGVLACCALLAVPAAASTDTRRCGAEAHEAETLARTPQLRIYSFYAEGQQVYACGPKLPRPVRIGPAPPNGRIWFAVIHRPLAVRGFTVAAAETQAEGTDFGTTWVRLVQVRDRRVSECKVGVWANGAGLRVRKLLVSPEGSLAWAALEGGGKPRAVLGLCGRNSKDAILDEDPGLQVGGIVLHGSVLRWTDSTGDHSLRIDSPDRLVTRS